MIKFIHTGDIHLGLQFSNVSFPREKAVERRRELWNTFQRIVNYSVDTGAHFLLIAGDLFEESYFTLGDIKRVRDILSSAKNVNILISAGNHDYIGNDSLYNKVEWSPNVTIFDCSYIERKEFPDYNTVVYGYSWNRINIRENNLLKNFPYDDRDKNRILLIHGDIGNVSDYLPLNLDELNGLNMNYIALGHIHKPNIYSQKIAYCGSPEPLNFGETGNHGIIEGFINENSTEIKLITFSKRNFLESEVMIDENMGYEDIIRKIIEVNNDQKHKDFYRVYLKGYIDSDIDLVNLHKDLMDNFYHIEIIDETIPDYNLDKIMEDNKDNIIGQFIETMKNKGLDNEVVESALYYGLDALLKGRINL